MAVEPARGQAGNRGKGKIPDSILLAAAHRAPVDGVLDAVVLNNKFGYFFLRSARCC